MKVINILIFLLLFTSQLFSQSNSNFKPKKDFNLKYRNQNIINYFIRNLTKIDSVNNKSIIAVPLEKEYKKDDPIDFIEGFYVQHDGNKNNPHIKYPKMKCIIFNFDLDLIEKDKIRNDDILDWAYPDSLIKKLKDKLNKKPKKLKVKK